MPRIEDIPLYDSADYLDTPESVVAYLEAAIEDRDPKQIARALGVVARARGMAVIAERTGLSRETLYRTLSEKGNPQLATFLCVLDALGLEIGVRPIRSRRASLAPA